MDDGLIIKVTSGVHEGVWVSTTSTNHTSLTFDGSEWIEADDKLYKDQANAYYFKRWDGN